MIKQIPIDFVAGSHGNYLETVCNHGFGYTGPEDNFTDAGTSHQKSSEYNANKVFIANHWFELYPETLQNFDTIISITFSQDDLLLLSSISLLRAGDFDIENDSLEHNTVAKLSRPEYCETLKLLYNSYPFLDQRNPDIPRTVLREFYKFGFKNPAVSGYWLKRTQMKYPRNSQTFEFKFESFYNTNKFVESLQNVSRFLDKNFVFDDAFYTRHEKFLSFIPYIDHKQQCDRLIRYVLNRTPAEIPELSLFQESYINGHIENFFKKEMPFQQDKYFTTTQDMLYYLDTTAPNL
jgi:hypothetical protein